MISDDRQDYIINLLATRSSVSVSELSETLRISEVSVRKLLNAMEHDGKIKRTWGGAVSVYGSLNEFSHKEKEPVRLEEKKAIAIAAYDCINDGDAVFLDCGTTNEQLAKIIKNGSKRNILVGTNAINIVNELIEAEDIHMIVVGGEFRHKILSCVGNFAEDMLSHLFFDKGFISGNHLTIEHGFTTPNLQEAQLKKMMMKYCKEHYIVLDHSKFGDDSWGLIAPTSELNTIITDWKTPAEFIKQLRDCGVKVIQGQNPDSNVENIQE